MLVAVGVDEGDGLPEVDGQLARNEIARVVADDANFQRSPQFDALLTCPPRLTALFRPPSAALLRVARPTVVLVVASPRLDPTVTRAVVVVLGKRERTAPVASRPRAAAGFPPPQYRLCGAPSVPARCESLAAVSRPGSEFMIRAPGIRVFSVTTARVELRHR